MIDFDEAVRRIGEAAVPLGREFASLWDAHGRVLAAEVRARIDSPAQDNAAMDGYAVREPDLAAMPARLRLAGESWAGRACEGPVEAGRSVRIFTGATLPAGADRVIVQEMARREGDFVIFDERPGDSRHIRRRGSDFQVGEILLEAGRKLGPRDLVAAAAADVDSLELWRRPVVAIASTGDELADPGRARERPGAIPESVSLGVAALAAEWNGRIAIRTRLADDLPAMRAAAVELLDRADLVVVAGGASVGERDHAKAMFESAGLELVFSKVAIKPGKPVWFGRAAGKLVLGLPGNPTSAMVTARLFLAPLLAGLGGRAPGEALVWRTALLAASLPPCGERETFVRAALQQGRVQPVTNQDSGAQKSLAEADLLVRRRPGAPAAEAGEAVDIIDF